MEQSLEAGLSSAASESGVVDIGTPASAADASNAAFSAASSARVRVRVHVRVCVRVIECVCVFGEKGRAQLATQRNNYKYTAQGTHTTQHRQHGTWARPHMRRSTSHTTRQRGKVPTVRHQFLA